MKRTLLLILAFALVLSACSGGAGQGSSEATPPISEAEPAAMEPTPPSAPEPAPANLYDMEFTTDNGFQVSIHDSLADAIPETMPVLRVRPKTITIAMVRQAAKAAFGDAPLYEYTDEMTKAQIGDMIAAWEVGVTDEAIRDSYGENVSEEIMADVRQTRLNILDYYRNAYAYAKDDVEPVPCQWKFWPEGHYRQYNYTGADPSYTGDIPFGLSVDLEAVTTAEGIPYRLHVNNNETWNFRNHSLVFYVQEPFGLRSMEEGKEALDKRLRDFYQGLGLSSDQPATEEQLAAAIEKAAQLVQDMGFGDWTFTAEAIGPDAISCGGWQIYLEGRPIYEGFPVSKQTGLSNLRGTDPATQNYGYEDLHLNLSNDGKLVDFWYYAPLEVVEVVERAVPLVDWAQIEPRVRESFDQWTYEDVFHYDPDDPLSSYYESEVTSAVADIDSVRVGYARVKYDDTDFLLVPSITFWGELEVKGFYGYVPTSKPLQLYEHTGTQLAFDLRDGNFLQTRNPPA